MEKILKSLITDEEKHHSGLKNILDFSQLKFKEKDDLVDIFKSWNSKIPFNMEQLRDQRLRYHYKDRYDFRTNLIDWDYTMNLKEFVISTLFFLNYTKFLG